MTEQRSLPPDLYTEEYFLHACEGYEEFSETQGDRLSRRLAAAFAVAAILPGMRVLDIGCGRGEILRQCAVLGAEAYGIDYAPVAVDLAHGLTAKAGGSKLAPGKMGIYQADAKYPPFPANSFDRILMFDIVEHLFPWELTLSLASVKRMLKPGGAVIIHTAPNAWYDRYAYPGVRLARILMGQGSQYPRNPRALNVAINVHVHVNEQSPWGLRRVLRQAGFRDIRVWLASPPQHRREGLLLAALRSILFRVPPFRFFFEREIFAVGGKPSEEK